MSAANRRRACRLPLQVPVQLQGRDGPVDALMQDVSRTGVRLQVATQALGFAPTLELASTAQMVADRLDASIVMRLHHDALGSLLERTATITRLSIPSDAPDSVELGCQFEVPLSAEEATTLGVPLPPVEGDDEAFCPRADSAAPFRRTTVSELTADVEVPPERPDVAAEPSGQHAPAPRFGVSAKQTFRAYVASTADDAPPSLLCHTDHLSREAVRVRVPRTGYEGDTVAEATVRFTQRYGTRAGLKIMDIHQHLWTGPVRVCSLEMPAERGSDMLITLAFGRRLRPAELRRLGLATEAA